MLLYYNRSLRLMCHVAGSVVLRKSTLGFGSVLAAVAAVLQWMIDENVSYSPDLPHHYGMHALGVVVAFAIVFRTNLGWQRYWEAVTQLHYMYSKFADAYSQFYAFASVTVAEARSTGGAGTEAKVQRVVDEACRLEVLFHMLSALACHRLLNGDTQRMEATHRHSVWKKQIVERSELRPTEGPGCYSLPILVGENSSSDQPLEACNTAKAFWVKVAPDSETLAELQESPDRTNTIMHWILFSLAKVSKDLDIAPPIQSRMYQELSNGMLGFSNAQKIADVPFPFPYAQLLTVVLVMYSVFIPLYVTIFTRSMVIGPVMTFLLFVGVWCVNEVAIELENPFGTDLNDISVPDFHLRFSDALTDIRRANGIDLSSNKPMRLSSALATVVGMGWKSSATCAVRQSTPIDPCVDDKEVVLTEAPLATVIDTVAPGDKVLFGKASQVGADHSVEAARALKASEKLLVEVSESVRSHEQIPLRRTGSAMHCSSGGAAFHGTEVFDAQLQAITVRIEQHLEKISGDVETVIGLAALGQAPLISGAAQARSKSRDGGGTSTSTRMGGLAVVCTPAADVLQRSGVMASLGACSSQKLIHV